MTSGFLRRRTKPNPVRLRPTRASVPGSGTEVFGSVTVTWCEARASRPEARNRMLPLPSSSSILYISRLEQQSERPNIVTESSSVGPKRAIFRNYLYLERQLEKLTDPKTRVDLLRMIATHSQMTWAHINMLGECDFFEEKLKDSIGILT